MTEPFAVAGARLNRGFKGLHHRRLRILSHCKQVVRLSQGLRDHHMEEVR